MIYSIQITYMDGHQINLNLYEKNLTAFLEAAKQNVPYLDETRVQGFWAPMENIRYFRINRVAEEEKEGEDKEEITESVTNED